MMVDHSITYCLLYTHPVLHTGVYLYVVPERDVGGNLIGDITLHAVLVEGVDQNQVYVIDSCTGRSRNLSVALLECILVRQTQLE